MPRFFFDIDDGLHIEDTTGRDLPGSEVALMEARRTAAGYATEPKMLGKAGGAIIVTVRDAARTTLGTVRLVFTVENA